MLFSKATYNGSCSDGSANYARWEQLWLGVLLRDTSTLGEAVVQTSNLPVTSQPALPPELSQPHFIYFLKRFVGPPGDGVFRRWRGRQHGGRHLRRTQPWPSRSRCRTQGRWFRRRRTWLGFAGVVYRRTDRRTEGEGMAVLRTAVWTPCPRIEQSSSKAHQGWPPPLSSQHHVGWDCTELTLTVDTADYTWLGHAMRICIAVLLDIIDETTTMSVPVSKIHRRWTMNEQSGWLLMDNKVIPISIRIHCVFRPHCSSVPIITHYYQKPLRQTPCTGSIYRALIRHAFGCYFRPRPVVQTLILYLKSLEDEDCSWDTTELLR